MGRLGILKPGQDAFGQELWSIYNGQMVAGVVERDDGYFSARLDDSIYFSDYEDWSDIQRKAMEFVKGRVLDVGCGAGRHSLYLQGKGFDVVAIDYSSLATRVSMLRGVRNVKLMSLEHLDFKPGTFDTVLLLGGNFALLGTPSRAKRILRQLHNITSSTAVVLGETRDPYKTDNRLHLEYHEKNRKLGKLGGQARIRIRFEKTVTKWIEYMLVSKEEMTQLLKGAGWRLSEFIENEGPGYVGVLSRVLGVK